MEFSRRQFALAACALIGGGWQDSKPTAPAAETASKTALSRLSWLAGHWTGSLGTGEKVSHIDEHWAKPRGGRLLATSQIYRGERSWHQEFLQISLGPRKEIVLEMRHGLGEKAPYYRYDATHVGEREIVFKNAKYEGDRAYRIRYARDEAGALIVEVSHRLKPQAGLPRTKDRVTRFVLRSANE